MQKYYYIVFANIRIRNDNHFPDPNITNYDHLLWSGHDQTYLKMKKKKPEHDQLLNNKKKETDFGIPKNIKNKIRKLIIQHSDC